MSERPFTCPYCKHVFQWGEDVDSAIVMSFGAQWDKCRTNAHWKLRFHCIEAHMDKTEQCPRRMEQFNHLHPGHDWISVEDNTCSYCGSLSADAFFKAINDNAVLTPTDKNYKVYVSPNHKFYFQHLSVEQRHLFIELINKKMLKFGAPGYFYILPFFVELKDEI